MSFISPDAETDRVFNNADSFAMVFDRAWKKLIASKNPPESTDQRMEMVMQAVQDHPFLVAQPEMARQVAQFRLRLLDLN